jgi:hypothetical protein
VHTGPRAAALAAALGARAFAADSHIVYGPDERPGITETTGEELAHTLQDSPADVDRVDEQPQSTIQERLRQEALDIQRAVQVLSALAALRTTKAVWMSSGPKLAWVRSPTQGWSLQGPFQQTSFADWATQGEQSSALPELLDDPDARPGQHSWPKTPSSLRVRDWPSNLYRNGRFVVPWRAGGPDIVEFPSLNCWEVLLLAGYKAGQVTWNTLFELYTDFDRPAAITWDEHLKRKLVPEREQYDPNHSVLGPGDIVFFDGLGHVAMATGNGMELLTFSPPAQEFQFQGVIDEIRDTTIDDLRYRLGNDWGRPVTVTFGTPRWRHWQS